MKCRATGLHELRFFGLDGQPTCIRVARACHFVARLRGLIGQAAPAAGQGLWIEPCSAVHTFGVPDRLDLAFVSARMVVQRIDAAVPPRRIRIGHGACKVLEMRAGEAARIGLRAGMRLEWAVGMGMQTVSAGAAPGEKR